ncbi:glycoside hydrolase family 99-like domain-containing protein [Leucobacter ruminantium]|uniref:glycoside hydrolase family 99-like domain-containing protein n=1 Tax=Leucobacter ruminantium TaxID=1289170 RepID=UPI003C7D6A3E
MRCSGSSPPDARHSIGERTFRRTRNGAIVRAAKRPPLQHPSSYERWVERRSDKLRHDGRPEWQRVGAEGTVPRVGVLVHVYYQELVGEILERIAELPVPFDLIVTNASGLPLSLEPTEAGGHLRGLRVLDVPNRGRDILPMISVVNAGLLEPYDLVFKVHTKKSEWRESHESLGGTGEEWRNAFLDELAGDVDRMRDILSAFAEDPSIGLITAENCLVGPEHWGGDQQLTAELLRRLELDLAPSELLFASGSIYWVRGFLLNGLRALDLSSEDFDDEQGQVDGTTAHAIERAVGILCEEAGFSLREVQDLNDAAERESWRRYDPASPMEPEARVYPFYLPQFHTFPENNAWWGEGFTEWNNVAAAKPVFPGHRQPNLPSDLGYYDLRDPSVRPRQYELAKKSGLEGFMYYYYWFAGKRLMDLPVEELVASDDDHPFCLMWANENWTRTWDGSETNVLIAQDYDRVPAEQFIDDIRHLICDERYMRIDGRPLIAVYRISHIPDFERVIEHWRRRAEEFGLPGIELITVDVGSGFAGIDGDVREAGLDGTLEFPPHNRRWVGADHARLRLAPGFAGGIFRYDGMVAEAEEALLGGIEGYRYPGVLVNFDNTARRQGNPTFWLGSNPYTFRRWLRTAVTALQDRPAGHRVVFINAWNEWAEGAVLEPTQRFGRTYLQAVRSAVVCP